MSGAADGHGRAQGLRLECKWWTHRDLHPAEPIKSRLLRCLSFGSVKGAHSGSRTRTGDALDVAPLLLGYMSMKFGDPGGI